jgi:hypothetical protein
VIKISISARRALTCAGFALFVPLAACGGGGGSSPVTTPVTPPTTPPSTVANTSATQYLPLGAGNTWTYTSGGSMRDLGSISLPCSGCAIQGIAIESIGVYSPAGTQAGIFYYSKGSYPSGTYAGHAVTYFNGLSKDGGITVLTLEYSLDGKVPGVVVMDDAPTVGESFSFAAGAGSAIFPATSNITSIGGTQALGANTTINNVAQDLLSQSTSTFGFGFARGVGFASITTGGTTLNLSSFSINAATAFDAKRQSMSVQPRTVRPATPAELATIPAMLNQLAH